MTYVVSGEGTEADPIEFGAGTPADRAAAELAAIATVSGDTVHAVFNGTPMDAYVGDCARCVHIRWTYRRELIQRSGQL